jgi:small GTP-binding protein
MDQMPLPSDLDRINELKLKLLLNDGQGLAPFPQLELWQIIPKGDSGYACDQHGQVTGIKISLKGAEDAQEVLNIVLEFKRLERLVFYAVTRRSVRIPQSIEELKHLRFIWFGGNVRALPAELFAHQRPICVVSDSRNPGEAEREFQSIIGEYEDVLSSERGTPLVKPSESSVDEKTPDRSGVERNDAGEFRITSTKPQIRWLVARSLALTGIYLLSTIDLEDPPLEIVAKGRYAVLNYFYELEGGDLPLSEVKVLLVGNGSAGKTSLVKRVFGENFNPGEPQTHGINIRSYVMTADKMGDVKAHFWDFGGQEIMHATHQFFLSKRSIYILVLDGRKEEDAEYWLQHIESFGGESPILVVLNKIDENHAFDVNRRFLIAKYKGILGFYRVSCATGAGISDFRSSIEAALSRVTILQTRWPRTWFRVKQRLESLTAAYISVSEYSTLCAREGIIDQESQDNLVDFLHDLGVVLHFRDLQLLDTHVLEPRWVTGAVYRLITSDVLSTQQGVLELRQIGSLLERPSVDSFKYSKDKHTYIVEIMLKFELCYRLSSNSILVPDLLDVQEPALDFDYIGSLRFVLQYSYLPKSIVPRLIVRMNSDIKGTSRWRTGVQLEDRLSKAVALVRSDQKARRIEVFVKGEGRRDYFAVLRNVLSDINRSFEKLQVTEWVPLPDAPEVEVEFSDLIGHELAGREEIFIGKLRRPYNVSTLLNGIVKEQTRREQPHPTLVSVQGDFISQSVTASSVGVSNQQIVRENPKMVKRSYEPHAWERVTLFGTGVLFFALVGFLAIRNQPISDPNIVVLLRILMSLVTSIFGATVPGMLRVDFSNRGLVIRATGALALFVLTYVMTPSVLHLTPH